MSNKESAPIIVGLDHGNGWVKARTSSNQITLPSYIARREDLGEGLVGKALDVKEYESNHAKGEVYVWGPDVIKSKKLLSTYGSQDRYKQKYYGLLSQFALVEALSSLDMDVIENVWVISGVPSEEKGTSVEDDLKRTLTGSHLIKVNGEDKIIKVSKVVVLPQPVGTIMSLYLDDKGFVENDSYETANVGIIDLGTGTTDLDHINELRRLDDGTQSISIGMFDVYKTVAKHIKKQHPSFNVTPQLVEHQFNSSSFVLSKRAAVDITEIKEAALEEVAMDVKNNITQLWKNWEAFDKIMITGGGASSLGQKLKQLIDDAESVQDSQTANADGFYRYGEFLKGE